MLNLSQHNSHEVLYNLSTTAYYFIFLLLNVILFEKALLFLCRHHRMRLVLYRLLQLFFNTTLDPPPRLYSLDHAAHLIKNGAYGS